MTARFKETLYPGWEAEYAAEDVFFDSETEHQRLVIFNNAYFGRIMLLDGITQTTEADEFIYHEMLTHVPIFAHGNVKKVLIIGGGDGGMLREVLRHTTVEKCTMVEIDPGVVELAKEHLPNHSAGAFDDPRASLVFADGAAFAAEPDDRYDVMIVDSTDPIGPGEVLFQDSFYANARNCLQDGGILVTQNGVPFLQADELRDSVRHLRNVFEDVTCYLASIPTYVGGPMAFGWATNDQSLRTTSHTALNERYQAARFETRYYTPEVHRAAFALPPYIQKIMD